MLGLADAALGVHSLCGRLTPLFYIRPVRNPRAKTTFWGLSLAV
jgi:hypothetical protein